MLLNVLTLLRNTDETLAAVNIYIYLCVVEVSHQQSQTFSCWRLLASWIFTGLGCTLPRIGKVRS